MRKRSLLFLVAIFAAVCFSLGFFAACGESGSGDNGGTGGGDNPSGHTHSYVETVISPTCTEKGYTLHKCACGYEFLDNLTAALGHNLGEWKVTTPATEGKDGEETRVCTRENCDYTETRKIPAQEHTHDYKETVVEPTCTEKGYTLHKCACGDEYKDNETEALGHSFKNYVSDGNATCTKDGTKTAKCDRCDEKDTITDYKTALGHNFSTEWTVDKEATCQKTGIKSHHCTRCNAKTDETAIPLKDHNYINGVCTVCGNETIEEATGLEYALSEDKTYYIVTELGEETRTRFSIPSVHNGLPVKVIDSIAFYKKNNIVQVVLPDSIEKISYKAFYQCSELKEVVLGNGLLTIEEQAFRECGKLSNMIIPDSVTNIGAEMFYGCSSLTSVTIGNGVTNIGDSAFYGCSSLTSVTIPYSVTSIGYKAFSGCDKLIKTVKGVSYVDKWVIDCETSVTKVELKADTVGIAYGVFQYRGSLTSINIPDSVTSVSEYAFYDCRSLTSVTIGNGVTSIGHYAFFNCESLTGVYITDIAAWCNIKFDNYDSNPLSYAGKLYLNNELVTDLVIPDSVTSIGKYAFYGCRSLTSIMIPDSVTSIGNGAFNRCGSLINIEVSKNNNYYKTIQGNLYSADEKNLILYASAKMDVSFVIPDNVTSIGKDAFYDCRFLTSITIPDSVTSIGSYAFAYCSSLARITIGNGVKSIGDNAFYNCESLTGVYITDIAAWWNIKFGSGYSNPLSYAHNLYLNNELVTELVIPDGVTSIGGGAFMYCSSLTSITIPDSVTSIGGGAFNYCDSLTSIIYNGTKVEWQEIKKGDNWKWSTGNFTVHCTDGDLRRYEA